jgi:hypothetical protein
MFCLLLVFLLVLTVVLLAVSCLFSNLPRLYRILKSCVRRRFSRDSRGPYFALEALVSNLFLPSVPFSSVVHSIER